MKGQPRHHSLYEAILNVIVGAGVSFTGQLIIFPTVGLKVSLHQNLVIMAFFTVLSIARSYLLRRYFNRVMLKLHISN